MSFFSELKRRNVVRAAIAYALMGWILLQAADFVFDLIGAPPWVIQALATVVVLGLVVTLFFSWAFEITPEGIKRESDIDRSQSIAPQTGRKLDRMIIVFLAVAVVVLLGERILNKNDYNGAEKPAIVEASSDRQTADQQSLASNTSATNPNKPASESATKIPDDHSLAVLPFVAMSSGPDDEYFADGLTEEILNSLAQLPELLVTARTSAFSFKGKDLPINEIAETLNVGNIVEGSVRRSGDRVRVTAQLIRAKDGFHLWSETYDSTSADTIDIQEDIAEQIAVALNVVLDENKRQAMQLAGLRDVEAFTKYQKALHLYQAAHGETDQIPALRKVNELIEEVLERVPNYAPAHVEHSDLYAHIALNAASGESEPSVTEEDIANAVDNATHDYDQAILYARNEREKASFEFDRAYLSGEWRGITGRAEEVLDDDTCTFNNWLAPYALMFGKAAEYAEFAHIGRLCDPLATTEWFNEARALFWAGEPDKAIAVALEGNEVAPGDWLSNQLMYALLAKGRFEDADRVVITRLKSDLSAGTANMFIAAARGDRETTDRIYTDLQQYGDSTVWDMIHKAITGRHEMANAVAAELDKDPKNYLSFGIYTVWCACGAPFDLEYTPNFAAKIAEAGLPWPPVSPIDFPLKDW